ncbi:DUF3052 domain-containing protein [Kitasatospora sp. MAP5-34]|uniref:DUF3052 domain-containing protein n=1 Tax=Kitasatospora sp. MAP5-34 TaxID=3035102 RepID=UPI002475F930|nr:DUF3052 domain-containing protein [Kitasatospora sp. MAP5-34]MDH6578012.1 hypothetical protein [Kitasatospora sp. MAP5-34]
MAGYSGTPLAQKLGIKPGAVLLLVGAPPGFAVPGLPDGVLTRTAPDPDEPFDVAVWFPAGRAEYETRLAELRAAMGQAAGLWLAWPKRAARKAAAGKAAGPAAGLATDLDENVVREVALPTGLVDNKVCAIDETYSGLRLVIRRELRR